MLARVENRLAQSMGPSRKISKRKNVSVKSGSHPVDRLTAASQKLVIAAASPFNERAKGVYLANEHAKPSLKSNALARFTISGNAGDEVFILLGPQLTNDRVSAAIVRVNSGFTGNSIQDVFPECVVQAITLPHMYDSSGVADDKTLGVRGAACGLQIKYTGQTMNKGGSWSFLKLSDYVPLIVNPMVPEFGPLSYEASWADLISYIKSSRLTRITSIGQSITQEMALLPRPDAQFSSEAKLNYPMIKGGYTNPASDTSVLIRGGDDDNGATLYGGVFGVAYFRLQSAQQEFTAQLITHMEQKSDKLYQVHTPSPAHVQDHATVHQAIDKSHETHNDVPEKPLLHHVLDTIKSEAATVATRAGRSVFAGLMSEIRKPSNYEAMGLAAMTLL